MNMRYVDIDVVHALKLHATMREDASGAHMRFGAPFSPFMYMLKAQALHH